MQDIPRNELLDKLAAGWKVRRRNWDSGDFIDRNGGSSSCYWGELLKDSWEGEPPKPKCTANGCSIVHAFERLREGATFIRRGSGEDEVEVNSCYTNVALTTDDILANDWEVWG